MGKIEKKKKKLQEQIDYLQNELVESLTKKTSTTKEIDVAGQQRKIQDLKKQLQGLQVSVDIVNLHLWGYGINGNYIRFASERFPIRIRVAPQIKMLLWCNWLNIPSLQDGDEKYNPGSSPGRSTKNTLRLL